MNAKPDSEGMVIVQAGTCGGRGWDEAAIDRWLGEFTDGPMNHVGWVAMHCMKAHPVGGVPGPAGDPEACGGFDAKADRV